MARGKKKESALTPEEKLVQALVPDWEQPYKVPKNWCWTRLMHVAKWGSGGTPSRRNPAYYEGCIPWIKTGELNDDYIYETEEHISDEAIDNSSAKPFPINTVAIAMYGATIGKVGILGVEATTNQACACAVASPALDYRYLFRYAQAQKDAFIKKGKGGAQPNISQEIIKEHEIPLPPLAEQQRIVDRIEYLFAKLDEAKEKAQSVLDSFETRKAAILHKAFTGELTAKWRVEHDIGMDSWTEGALENFCEVNPPKTATKELPDDLDVSFVPMPALSDILGEITDPQVRKLKDVRTGFTNFSEGDVVFAKITPCMENGKSAVVGSLINNLGFGTTEFYVLRCSKLLFNRYLYHLLRSQSFRAEAKAVMTGAVGQQRVPKRFLEKYPIMLPSVPEQVEIVCILDSLFTKDQQAKEAVETVLEKIDLLKKSILVRAFRGELGTNDPTEESAVSLLQKVLETEAPSEPRKRSKTIPKELKAKLNTELERDIIKLYFKTGSDTLPVEELLSVSSKKFEIMNTLRMLEQRRILKKSPNGKYTLLE